MGNEKFCDFCEKLIERGKGCKSISSLHVSNLYENEFGIPDEKEKIFCSWKCVALYAIYKFRLSVIKETRRDGERRLGVFFTCGGKDIPKEWVEQIKPTGTDQYRVKKGFFLNLLEEEIK